MSQNVDEKACENALLQVVGFEGELRAEKHSAPMRWSVTIGRHGGIALTFETTAATAENKWLFEAAFPDGPLLQPLSVNGKTSDGVTCSTDSLYVASYSHTTDEQGHRLTIGGDASNLRLLYKELPKSSDGLRIIYFTVGMRAFGAPQADTNVGKLSLAGPSQLEQPDDVAGRITIAAPAEGRPFEAWLSDCDAIVSRVLDMVSFAEGGLIRWSARRIEDSTELVAIDCEGAKESGPSFDGFYSHLNLQPVLDLAIQRYTEELCESTGLAIALEWFVHHPRYAELQLLSASTALEHLIATFVKKHGVPMLMEPQAFKGHLSRTQELWKEVAAGTKADERAAIERILNKLTRLNEGSFYDKLVAMTRSYQIPLANIDLRQIKDAIDARNLVVHRGLFRSEKERRLHEYVLLLRELLKRIFLTLLGYQGQYFSLLNGPQWLRFPPE